MATNRNRRTLLLALTGLVALGAGSGSYLLLRSGRGKPPDLARPDGLLWPQVRPLPPLDLIDHDGERFGREDFEGRWSLVFFGYTSCPDICPMTLAILNRVRQRLAGNDPGFGGPQTILVSVDPARDTPQRLREYVRHFNEDFIGVSGEHQQLQALTRALGTVYMTEEPDANGDYLVHHSATIFLISPRAELAGVLTSPHEPVSLAERLRDMMDYMQAQA
jgi:protein SCO1